MRQTRTYSEFSLLFPMIIAQILTMVALLRSVASALCVGLAETLNKIGPAFVDGRMSHRS